MSTSLLSDTADGVLALTLNGPELSLEAGLDCERRNFFMLFASDDQKEGMAAFIEKRKPTWKGR